VPVLLTRQGWSVGMAGVAVSLYSSRPAWAGSRADRSRTGRFQARHRRLDDPLGPLLVAATRMEGWPLVVLLAAGGFFLQSTLPVNVTFAHEIAPVSAATVSSLMMGFAWGTGGLTAPLVGRWPIASGSNRP